MEWEEALETKKRKVQSIDKALELLKQKRENARLDLETDVMFHEKELTAQIDTYTDCIETIKNIASKSNYEELEEEKMYIEELERENRELKQWKENIEKAFNHLSSLRPITTFQFENGNDINSYILNITNAISEYASFDNMILNAVYEKVDKKLSEENQALKKQLATIKNDMIEDV